MPRPTIAALLAGLLLIAGPARAEPPAEAIRRAQALLDHDDGRAAAAVLETALPDADAESRPALIQELRHAYDRAALQAEADGDTRAAQTYRENLAILNHKTQSPPQPEAAPAPAAEAVADVEPVADASTGEVVAEEPAVDPDEEALLGADDAFRAREYADAGRIYAELAGRNHLPESRRDAWAYCRYVDVVRRINAGPRGRDEWSKIHAEIAQIRRLSPRNWYGEYLRNLVAERSGIGRSNPKRVILRGSSPDESAPTRRRPGGPRRAFSPIPPPEVPEPSANADGRRGAALENWQVWETPNFRIFHADEALARRVARLAETTRAAQARRWAGASPMAPWTPRCDLYLYPTAAIFSAKTGQPAESPGFSTWGQVAGQINARRINLRVDAPKLLTAVLPHEVTHLVLAEIFADLPYVPRWADEGMAVLAEPAAEQRRRAAGLTGPIAEGKLFPLETLMTIDYPDGRSWDLYYAQSASVTRFLIARGTPAQFVEFLRGAQRNLNASQSAGPRASWEAALRAGLDAELKRVYRIDGLADLQRRWLDDARGGRGTDRAVAASAGNGVERR